MGYKFSRQDKDRERKKDKDAPVVMDFIPEVEGILKNAFPLVEVQLCPVRLTLMVAAKVPKKPEHAIADDAQHSIFSPSFD